MQGEITFDIFIDEDTPHDVFEGCYRVPPNDWKVFYFTKWWQDDSGPEIIKDAVFSSGVLGINVKYAKDQILNKLAVKRVLSEALGVQNWVEVKGPDSLRLK
jgi:hypothetical protein